MSAMCFELRTSLSRRRPSLVRGASFGAVDLKGLPDGDVVSQGANPAGHR